MDFFAMLSHKDFFFVKCFVLFESELVTVQFWYEKELLGQISRMLCRFDVIIQDDVRVSDDTVLVSA